MWRTRYRLMASSFNSSDVRLCAVWEVGDIHRAGIYREKFPSGSSASFFNRSVRMLRKYERKTGPLWSAVWYRRNRYPTGRIRLHCDVTLVWHLVSTVRYSALLSDTPEVAHTSRMEIETRVNLPTTQRIVTTFALRSPDVRYVSEIWKRNCRAQHDKTPRPRENNTHRVRTIAAIFEKTRKTSF